MGFYSNNVSPSLISTNKIATVNSFVTKRPCDVAKATCNLIRGFYKCSPSLGGAILLEECIFKSRTEAREVLKLFQQHFHLVSSTLLSPVKQQEERYNRVKLKQATRTIFIYDSGGQWREGLGSRDGPCLEGSNSINFISLLIIVVYHFIYFTGNFHK